MSLIDYYCLLTYFVSFYAHKINHICCLFNMKLKDKYGEKKKTLPNIVILGKYTYKNY